MVPLQVAWWPRPKRVWSSSRPSRVQPRRWIRPGRGTTRDGSGERPGENHGEMSEYSKEWRFSAEKNGRIWELCAMSNPSNMRVFLCKLRRFELSKWEAAVPPNTLIAARYRCRYINKSTHERSEIEMCSAFWAGCREQVQAGSGSTSLAAHAFFLTLYWLVVWNMCYSIFPYCGGLIIRIDFHMFQGGWSHQPDYGFGLLGGICWALFLFLSFLLLDIIHAEARWCNNIGISPGFISICIEYLHI